MDNDVKYLLSLQAVRDQASKVFESAKKGNLKHFDYDEGRMGAVADYVSKVIDVSNTKSSRIPSVLHSLRACALRPGSILCTLCIASISLVRAAALCSDTSQCLRICRMPLRYTFFSKFRHNSMGVISWRR